MTLVVVALTLPAPPLSAAEPTYRNPLPIDSPLGPVESCADPSVEYDPASSDWVMVCTMDPLNDEDRTGTGDYVFRFIPTFRSDDLVNWTYVGDAFAARPAYAHATAGLWAPEIIRDPAASAEARWRLYYTVTATTLPGGGSAIGVATGPTPWGPWTHAGAPVVEPHAPDCCPGDRRWVFDPEVLLTSGPDYLYYGSYFGGLSVRVLAENGLTTDPATQDNVAIANKFEGPEVVERNGWYYLFASATDCCRGPLTGYSVFVGRSASPTGPFLDQHGIDLNDDEGAPGGDPTDARAGGTPVLSMSGNEWVGPGHNTVFQDFAGQWWTIYHAIDVDEPYFADAVGFTKRPALLDPIDWVDGWPVVRSGDFISDTPQHGPAAQPGETTAYRAKAPKDDRLGALIWAEEFDGAGIDGSWSWVREPAGGVAVGGGVLAWDTQAADLHVDSNNASVLVRDAPDGPYVVETRVRVTVPAEGCCFNFVQGGLVLYGDDDNYLKLVTVSIWNTRQTEFAKEEAPVPAGYPRYGNTIVGPPGEWTWLRIVVEPGGEDGDRYRAWTSPNGVVWDRGGTWVHELDGDPRIGLVSMGGSGFRTDVDYVRVYRLKG